MNEKDNKANLIMVGVFIIVVGVFVVSFIKDGIEMNNARNSFCKSEGYEGATDYNFYDGIECDNSVIFSVNYHFPCVKQNKWGACLKTETTRVIVKMEVNK